MTDSTIINQHSRDLDDASEAANETWTQYVTFTVDGRFYGIEITKVREIKGWSEPTALPNAPHAMRGVLNLRGLIVPIFDLGACFGQGVTAESDKHVVIILSLGERLIGLLVESVSDILTLEAGEVLPVPGMGNDCDQRFLSGLVSQDHRMVALLKLEELFGIDDIPSELAG